MNACENCPNRNIADLAEAVGAEELAARIRERGCGWWWYVEADKSGRKPEWKCGAEHLPEHLNRMGGLMTFAARTVQDDRNEQAKALEQIEAAAAEHGAGRVLQACAGLGLLTAQARLQTQNGRPGISETAAGPSDAPALPGSHPHGQKVASVQSAGAQACEDGADADAIANAQENGAVRVVHADAAAREHLTDEPK